ncbi:MAG: hypothetical protein WBM80_04580 [Woeseiaceae bacterium]
MLVRTAEQYLPQSSVSVSTFDEQVVVAPQYLSDYLDKWFSDKHFRVYRDSVSRD